MGTVTKRSVGWQCKVRKAGYPAQSKTFKHKADADAWGRDVEARMARGDFNGVTAVPVQDKIDTVSDLLSKYLKEESPKKARKGQADRARIATLKKHLGAYSIHTLTSAIVTQYKKDRLKERAPQTVTHELNLLHRAYVVATEEWGVQLNKPIPKTTRPQLPEGRNDRVKPKLVTAIVLATESPELGEIVQFAVETAMRRAEVASIDWGDVNLRRKTVFLPKTKTKSPRTIPLTNKALQILRDRNTGRDGPVFTLEPDSITQAFKRAAVRCGKPKLTFHLLRHEAISRLFERGLNVLEVSRISGHKTLSQLDRYTHLDVSDLGKKLRA